MIFFDTETCGFHGPIVLLQYADGIDGEVKLHSVWKESIESTLEIFDDIIYDKEGIVGFNVAYDWFHICQMYTTLLLIPRSKWDEPPDIEEYASFEAEGRFGPCIKPMKACDLMLHARRGPYQSTMNRGDIWIKKVPTALAWQLADELEKRIVLKDIYFARSKEKKERKWIIKDIEGRDGKVNPDFKNLILKFAPSSALKVLAQDALELNGVLTFKDIDLPKNMFPNELGYAPFATAIGNSDNWRGAWPDKISQHISHWHHYPKAREYAKLDVVYLQKLYDYFDCPELGDDDSELACMIGAVRWRGFAIDIEGLRKLKEETAKRNIKILTPQEAEGKMFLSAVPDKPGYRYFKIPTSPAVAKAYIREALSEMERLGFEGSDHDINVSTGKAILEKMVHSPLWRIPCCDKNKDCEKCKGLGYTIHEAAKRAKEILEARQANYEADFYSKLILAGRFHASSSVTGALSGRMSGGGSARGIEGGGRAKGDKLNPQGVKRDKVVRKQFPLADGGLILCAGDFSGFEVTIAEAVYNDPELRKLLLSGKSVHAIFGTFLFPGMTYEEIMASKGQPEDFYDKSKRSFFASLYGGNAFTINDRIGIPIEVAEQAFKMFEERFPGVRINREKISGMFCSMRQPNGIGTIVEWHEPADYIEAGFGFRRYFTLENSICKALFDLGSDPPKEWQDLKIKTVRRDRVQLVGGAVRSALFAAAFAIQGSNLRAAANHQIQSFGALITKRLQRNLWDLQPPGIRDWKVQPLNIHDEIQLPCAPDMIGKIEQVVKETVEAIRPQVPLIEMDWKSNLKNWSDK